ncbi:hypothetical protein HOU03_gp282 [Caulobacter phage CcrSC]|uniref:Uncharacterized protein n=1 Tax=Caulobacter phage CcrSC TaxID=2283272 RepID=A0A385EE90_9CAUD|nr:hypothetical protein HOU03_gp282 [Caulobacter phage CcrSC]AXQ69986.1 hypothetical protein CcrSC_gp404 [Caulobacter phage CcrSC]
MTFDRSRPLYRYFALPEDGGPGWFEVGADNRPLPRKVPELTEFALRRFLSAADWGDAFLTALGEHKKATIYFGPDSVELARDVSDAHKLNFRRGDFGRFMPYFYYNDGSRQAGTGAPKRSPAEEAAFGYEIVGADGEHKHVLDATRDELLLAIVNLTDCMEAVRSDVLVRLKQIDRSYNTGDHIANCLEAG